MTPIKIVGIAIGEKPKTKFYCYTSVLIEDDEGVKWICVRKGRSPQSYVKPEDAQRKLKGVF